MHVFFGIICAVRIKEQCNSEEIIKMFTSFFLFFFFMCRHFIYLELILLSSVQCSLNLPKFQMAALLSVIHLASILPY